jgi:hypothetical protein
MPIDLEFVERTYEADYHKNRKVRGRILARDRPSRKHSRDRPNPSGWLGPNERDLPCWKRPCPHLLTPNAHAHRTLTASCEQRSQLLDWKQSSRYKPALLALSAHWRDWVRPLDSWLLPEDAPPQQFRSLIRHLFALYEVPEFLDAAWLDGLTSDGVVYQEWYKHIGRGQNIRTAKGLPLALTKRMAHHFVRAPTEYPIPAALRYAQVLGLGGDERLARSLLATRLGTDFRDNDFWETVIGWFIDQSTIEPVHHGPIIDYLHAQKFVASVANPRSRRRGMPRQCLLIPPQPNLSMKGRTSVAMLRAVERWHKTLRSIPRSSPIEWKSSGIPPLVLQVGDGPNQRIYETTELISTEELQAEGTAMLHCVASYFPQCVTGWMSIWSMTVEDPSGQVSRLLTLQIMNGSIVQARGRCNRIATKDELMHLTNWEIAGGPSLSWSLIAQPPIG